MVFANFCICTDLVCEQALFFFRFSNEGTRVAVCVSRVLLDGLQKKERLLVVSLILGSRES